MILFDAFLLLSVSLAVGMKSVFLGVIVLVSGLLVSFQIGRTGRLVGSEANPVTNVKKIKALLLAILIGVCLYPISASGPIVPPSSEIMNKEETLFPLIIIIALFASFLMTALVMERKRR